MIQELNVYVDPETKKLTSMESSPYHPDWTHLEATYGKGGASSGDGPWRLLIQRRTWRVYIYHDREGHFELRFFYEDPR